MQRTRLLRSTALAGTVMALAGCVAPTLTVVPGQGKNYTDLQRDDAACRGAPATSATAPATGSTADSGDYYRCMSAHGQLVVAQQPAVYPAYAAYPAYPAYGYGYPYAGYPYFGYLNPYLGLGLGFGVGYGFYGRGFYPGFYRGYYGGGFRGGYGGFRGGGRH